MLQKLFSLIIFFAIFVVLSVVVSIVPVSYLKQMAYDSLERMSIKVVNSDVWNLRLFGLSAYTSYISFEKVFDKTGAKIKVHVKDLSFKLINRSNFCSSTKVDVYIEKQEAIRETLLEIFQLANDLHYFISTNNLIITIYVNSSPFIADAKNNLSVVQILNNKNDNNVQTNNSVNNYKNYKTVFELSFSNVALIKNSNETIYQFNTLFKKNENVDFVLKHINNKKNNGNLDVKVDSESFKCYMHDNFKKGEIICKVKNFADFLEGLEVNIIDHFYKNVFDKTISFSSEILHQNDDVFVLKGNVGINDDFGDLLYNGYKKSININFDKIDFDKKHLEDVNLAINILSTDISKDLSKKYIRNYNDDINTLSQLIRMIFYFSQLSYFSANVAVSDVFINDTNAKNLSLKINKDANSDKIEIYNFSGNIGNDVFKIEKRNDGKNVFIATGANFLSFCNVFNINYIKYNGFLKNYLIEGLVDVYTDGVSINNTRIFINNEKIFSYNFDYKYDSILNKKKVSKVINIDNVKLLGDYVNFDLLYRKYYGYFLEYQSAQKQNLSILKNILLYSSNEDVVKNTITITNSNLFDNRIDNLVLTTDKKNNNIEFNFIANSDFFKGFIGFKTSNVNEYCNANIDIKANYINLLKLQHFKNDFELAIKETINKAFFYDKDYNVPSFFGLNGKISIDIDDFIFSSNGRNCDKLTGVINIGNGVFLSDDLSCKMSNNSSISAILQLSLQSSPEANIGVTVSGVGTDLFVKTPIDGNVYAQCVLYTRGFNPVNWLKMLDGKCSFVLQSFTLDSFDLISLGKTLIENGTNKETDYNTIIRSDSLRFSQSNGNIFINDGVAKGDIKFSRELVSGSAEYEYDIFNRNIKKLFGSFAIMGKRSKDENPFAFYVPFSCTGTAIAPNCLVNWSQLEQMIES